MKREKEEGKEGGRKEKRKKRREGGKEKGKGRKINSVERKNYSRGMCSTALCIDVG